MTKVLETTLAAAAVLVTGCGAGGGGSGDGSHECKIDVAGSSNSGVPSASYACRAPTGYPADPPVVALLQNTYYQTPNVGALYINATGGPFIDIMFLGPPATATETSPNILPVAAQAPQPGRAAIGYPHINCYTPPGGGYGWGTAVVVTGANMGREELHNTRYDLTLDSLEPIDGSGSYQSFVAHGRIHVDCGYVGTFDGVRPDGATVTVDATF